MSKYYIPFIRCYDKKTQHTEEIEFYVYAHFQEIQNT